MVQTTAMTPTHNRITRTTWMSLVALMVLSSFTGCATVLSEKRYPLTVDNAPGATYFSVHDRKNRVIHQGVTPQQVSLDAKAFPFWPAKYSVVFAGHENTSQVKSVKAGVDPWAAGNIVFGGIPGLVVDGATGAMFKLPKTVTGNVPLQFAVTDSNAGSELVQVAMNTPADQPSQDSVLPPMATRTTPAGIAAATPDANTPQVHVAQVGSLQR